MRFIERLCPPALLYLLFVTIQIALDVSLGLLFVAAVKVVIGALIVYALNALCVVNLGVVAWLFIATPFIITSLATAIAIGIRASKEEFGLSSRPIPQADEMLVKS